MNPFEHGLKKYLSAKQLKKIRSVGIGICGAGGLGSNVAAMLTRCGFCHFEILDSDNIEPSNLNRQHFFLNDIGKNKVSALKQHLRRINPDITVKIHTVRWSRELSQKFFQHCDVVIEAFDGAKNKHAVVESYTSTAKYVLSGSGMAGKNITTPLLIKKVGNVFLVGDQTTASSRRNPPLAPRVTACAALMAGVVMQLVLTGARSFGNGAAGPRRRPRKR